MTNEKDSTKNDTNETAGAGGSDSMALVRFAGTTPTINKKYLITTDEWFIAPDGYTYKSVFGTLKKVSSDEEVLNIKTNRASTNWYLTIGNMIIAGCQVHYCIQCDHVDSKPMLREIESNGRLEFVQEYKSRIYNSDEQI